MQEMIRYALVAGSLLACGPGDTDPPVDAPPGGSARFVIDWTTRPEVWPTVLGNLRFEHASLQFDSFRLVGDAGPGDSRTTAMNFALVWDEDVVDPPADHEFPDAPTGYYSQIALDIDGRTAVPSFKVTGEVTLDSVQYDFVVTGLDPLPFTVPIDVTLAPAKMQTLGVRFDFAAAIQAIDFAALSEVDGKLTLADSDPQMKTFRDALTGTLGVTAPAPSGVP